MSFSSWLSAVLSATVSIAGLVGAGFMTFSAVAQAPDPDRLNLMIEALNRLTPEQVEANPKLKAALDKVLEATVGTSQYVELVKKFNQKNQNPGLLTTALQNATNSTGADALRLLLDNAGANLVQRSLDDTNPAVCSRVIELLGNTGDKRTVPLLEPFVTDASRDITLRKQAVRSLAKIQEGAGFLLGLAKAGRLPEELKFTASTELNHVPWTNLKAEAAQTLPLPQGQNAQALPPIADLIRMKGDPKRGAEVFRRDAVACIKCHQVNGEGIEVGPNLSEIGTKLGKDALCESILDPSAGVSFGYEAWQIELRNGDEAFGLIVSETEDDISVKAQTGITTKYRKSDVAKREKQKLSIMPAGLQQAMSMQDFVDLIEYLSSLKKAAQ